MLRLAIQCSIREGGFNVEESQLKVLSAPPAEDEYVEFWPAGTLAKGPFCCTGCGNCVTVHQVLPSCRVCGERLWERADWSPFGRSSAPG
jgi:hypothetical protein